MEDQVTCITGLIDAALRNSHPAAPKPANFDEWMGLVMGLIVNFLLTLKERALPICSCVPTTSKCGPFQQSICNASGWARELRPSMSSKLFARFFEVGRPRLPKRSFDSHRFLCELCANQTERWYGSYVACGRLSSPERMCSLCEQGQNRTYCFNFDIIIFGALCERCRWWRLMSTRRWLC